MATLQKILQAHPPSQHGTPPWAQQPCPPPTNLPQITQQAIDMYLYSKQPNGDMGGIGWWQAANGYTAIALHDLNTGSKHNYGVLAEALRQCEARQRDFVNEFNDDSLWWALCCVHMYSIGGESWFLEKARAVWKHVLKSKCLCRRGDANLGGMDMEGACFWTTKPDEEQLNSISTGLFAELSVRLALADSGHSSSTSTSTREHFANKLFHKKPASHDDYLERARASLGWILRCRYRPEDALVLDNILIKQQLPQDWTFTYSTGVAMGVCALLYEATQEPEYLSLACVMAHKAMRRSDWVEPNGVLTERGAFGHGTHDPGENNDAVGFKAVLVRQLGTLYRVIGQSGRADDAARGCASLIKTFVNVNMKSQLEQNTNGNGQYGPWWAGPFEMPTSHSQHAVLDVMAAAALVNRM